MRFSRAARAWLALPGSALLAGCNTVLLNPSGDVAAQQGRLVVISTVLMLLIIVPVIIATLVFAWRYRQSNTSAPYTPEWNHSIQLELLIWAAPLLIIIALGAITWISTHTLDPYRPLGRIDRNRPIGLETPVLDIDVVALDWKWLFIYPGQDVAALNELAAPVNMPIRFHITADTVMNSFFIPALAGQIYAMPGMQTELNAVINRPGDFEGLSANYSGAGFSGMHFTFHAVSAEDFGKWVAAARTASAALDRDAYRALQRPSSRDPARRFASVEAGLYDAILNRCVEPGTPCLSAVMASDALRIQRPSTAIEREN